MTSTTNTMSKTVNLEDVIKLIDKIGDRYASGAYTNAAKSIRKEIVSELQSLPSESKEGWISVDKMDGMVSERIVLLFESGSMCFYNDEQYPFDIIVGAFELPSPPTK